MKKIFLLVLFLSLPLMISAQNLNGSISSSFYTFERFDDLNTSDTFIRNYEALSLNFNYNKVSLRTRLNFETNLGNTLESDPRLRFYNLFLEARDIFDVFTVKLGRQPLFTPVGGGLYDGVNLKFRYSGVSLTGFYGGNVPAYQKLNITNDFKNDYVLGGKFEVNFLNHFNFGLSYIDKNFKPMDFTAWRLDGNLNLIQVLIEQKSNQYKFMTAEASYFLDGKINLDTRYEYDVNYKTTSKFEVSGRVQATGELGVDVYYNFREPKIRYNSIFSVFDYGNSQEIEGGVDYKFSKDVTVFGKYGYVKYKDENSGRINLGTTTKYGTLSYRRTFGYAGELYVISFYTGHSFADGFITPSVGIAFTNYKLSPDAEVNNITTLLGGINLRPGKEFSFDLQGQYFNNKIYKNDFRILFKVNYWFNTNL
ncbi:MAG: hypothetical protein CVV24_03455 [Ignavibacteriae bacterium HGW-Ignavibacteriae-3]|nr:MAG: hypothetical protein CVV24_03455 [Ignavibacteriae bacterium HGW-Ignavibacteriae-3]